MIDSVPQTEYVWQISDEIQLQTLKKHFGDFYRLLVEHKHIPQARHEKDGFLEKFYSGIPAVHFNAVIGWLKNPKEYDARIAKEMKFFGNTPFFWYVDEDADPKFKEALKKRGFTEAGIYRGVLGPLDCSIELSSIPEGCHLEMVQDEKTMTEFCSLICSVFGLSANLEESLKTIFWGLTQDEPRLWYHWVARKDGKIVSALSTMIEDGLVSFWNGASAPELRRQGLSTALRRYALQHAVANGAKYGSSCLMSEGLAFGICSKLGYQTKWRFHAFVSPTPNVKVLP